MSDILKKLKSESGSAMILALFLMILVSIVMISFSNQVANQVKSTMNLNKDRQEMYDRESEIEEFIENFIKNIEVSTYNTFSDKDLHSARRDSPEYGLNMIISMIK